MAGFSRRELFVRGAKLAMGAVALTVPEVLYRTPWTTLAAAQTPPNVEANFVAAVEAVTTVADEATARWIIHEFDRALPPLPESSVSAAVSAVLDAHAVMVGAGPTFFAASPEGRREALAAMVTSDTPDIRQIANQVIPFVAFGYWSDATLDAVAQPGGPRLERWDDAGFPGPSHGYAHTYMQDSPAGFSPMTDFEA